jgi:hypothetical protein
MPIGGGKFVRHTLWILKKKLQVIIRERLSHWLALALAVSVMIREREELKQLGKFAKIPSGFQWFILGLTVVTVLAAVWELYGNKLTTSPQEVRFLTAVRSLLLELERLAYGKDIEVPPSSELQRFMEGFLRITSETLSGPGKVDAGIMFKVPSEEMLTLTKASESANYPPDLQIPVPKENTEEDSGPAGVSFHRLRLVYVPKKKRKESWPFRLVHNEKGETYEPSEPVVCWVPAPQPDQEDFKTVLCVPVAVYSEKYKKSRYGVLNFSTKKNDPFVDRDFMMAECFASILGHAVASTKSKLGTAK